MICPDCSGDGKETCHNPDHGFISALSFHDIGRCGCPVCGHHPQGKVRGGAPCETCEGSGQVTEEKGREFCDGMEYDFEDFQARLTPTTTPASSQD